MLGAFDDPQELDRPDLNKCPDCECYFSGDNCPLCGKPCPEDMRAGNRKPPKKQKHRRSSSSRVTFIEWYHSWWFIIVALIVFPIAGIALLVTSPHKRSSKITFVVIGAIYLVISTVGIGTIIGGIAQLIDPVVDTTLNREEYIEKCEDASLEDYYRSVDSYKDKFVSMTLKVTEVFVDGDAYGINRKYTTYYMCTDASGSRFQIMVRNCVQDKNENLVVGDVIRVYGEGAGNVTVYDAKDYAPRSAPCINVAYLDVIEP